MAPIKVGFLGLSTSGWARTAHLPMLKESDKYQIVAICNSSVESSQAAVKQYELPAETKTYGDPEDLAKDPNVDLVVCSVRVDRHFATIAPSLRAGKDVYVEWPLGKNLSEAQELLKLKNEGKVKVATVGLQARQAPIIKTVNKLIADGKIGNVLSSTFTGQGGQGGKTTMEGYAYLSDREVGGNLVTIHFGHAIDFVQSVLGYGFESTKSLLANRRKTQVLLGKDGEAIDEKRAKTADDTIFLHGVLNTGVPLSVSFRGGAPFAGEPGLDWRIYGDEGEIRITAAGVFLQIGFPDMKIQLMRGEGGEVEEVEIEKDEFDEGEQFPMASRNVARVYKGLSAGENNCSFEDAVERHELLDAMYRENGYDA